MSIHQKPVFNSYARYYDLLYKDKDYRSEAMYVLKQIHAFSPGAVSLLELGCGTGGHAEELVSAGCRVAGIDLSREMLARAEGRKSQMPADMAKNFTFAYGDVRSFRTQEKFDSVISLFHVMSYQTANSDLLAAFRTAKEHLKPGGVFLFDCWYGPGVLSDRPKHVDKIMEDAATKVFRKTAPVMCVNEDIVEVNYDVSVTDKASSMEQKIQETHRMRYLFAPEVENFLAQTGLKLVALKKWLSEESPDDNSWYAVFVAKNEA